jgi:putative flippase GtrA
MGRWFVFNVVGVVGFGVQLGVLAFLLWAGVPYLAATAVAVEAAVLHNFFHLLNGLVSLAGNLAIMRVLVGTLHVPELRANAVAVVACALVNYVAGDRAVFVPPLRPPLSARVPRRRSSAWLTWLAEAPWLPHIPATPTTPSHAQRPETPR